MSGTYWARPVTQTGSCSWERPEDLAGVASFLAKAVIVLIHYDYADVASCIDV